MRALHRALALIAGIFLLYMATTGVAIQSIDLSALLRHAPASDPNIQSMHEGINGPPNFQVITDDDYAAEFLPSSLDFQRALSLALATLREVEPSAALVFLEFRMQGGAPLVHVKTNNQEWRFDAMSGSALPAGHIDDPSATPGPIKSDHNTFKNLHRMTAYGQWVTPLTLVIGMCLCMFLITGAFLYARLYAARSRLRGKGLFWFAGGWWRSVHRAVAVITSIWILVIAVSGTWLALETVEIATYVLIHGQRAGLRADVSSPLQDSLLALQIKTTLSAHEAAMPGVPVKVLRLRNFAGMPQGVVVAGNGAGDAQQWVYNSMTGRSASEWEPGYPPTGYLTGWQLHETIKKIHRGDYFGITGRWFDWVTGLSIIFLAVSGGAMYYSMWIQRRRGGRKALYWK